MDPQSTVHQRLPEFLYVLRVTRPAMLTDGPTAAEAAVVGRHFEYLSELTLQGIVLMAGRTLTTDESTRGYVVLRAPDEKVARSLMAGDPAVAEGVMTAELFPYKVALWHGSYSADNG